MAHDQTPSNLRARLLGIASHRPSRPRTVRIPQGLRGSRRGEASTRRTSCTTRFERTSSSRTSRWRRKWIEHPRRRRNRTVHVHERRCCSFKWRNWISTWFQSRIPSSRRRTFNEPSFFVLSRSRSSRLPPPNLVIPIPLPTLHSHPLSPPSSLFVVSRDSHHSSQPRQTSSFLLGTQQAPSFGVEGEVDGFSRRESVGSGVRRGGC